MRIYDCFTFYNEIELLKFRLELLTDTVDYFVIVECSKTQTGADKPFNYLLHKNEFFQWNDKIIYIQADDIPEYKGENDWTIENYQRNCILRGLSYSNIKPDDLIIISDLDEIVNPDLLNNLKSYKVIPFDTSYGMKWSMRRFFQLIGTNKNLVKRNTLSFFLDFTPVVLQQSFFYYYINCKRNIKWNGSILLKYKNITLPQQLRNNRNFLPYAVGNVGWHFSYLGGKDKILDKLKAIVEGHNVHIPEDVTIEEYVANCIENGIDLYGDKNILYTFIEPELLGISDIQKYVKEYPSFFKKYI
jgi:beta-1,4-mannosyl-glycoprotein beta-1,4-N-acetylglucosaminyltransferase